MSTDNVEGTLGAPESPVEASAPHSGAAVPEEPVKANREARYRVERNEARESLSASQERLARMQTAECYRLAREAGLSVGADLMLAGIELSEYLTEDGLVDAEAVAEAAKAVLAERPALKRLDAARDPSHNTGGSPKQPSPSWGSLFRN